MTTKKVKLVCATLASLTSIGAYADQYLCTGDKATGFSFDKASGQWVAKVFSTESKWIVRMKAGTKTYEVVRMGENESTYDCGKAEGPLDSGIFRCDGVGSFVVNTKAGRYEARGHEAYAYANLLGGDAKSADVWIEIGRCSSF